jgi:hypothetical protein
MNHRTFVAPTIAALLTAGLASTALAQWTVVNLHPVGAVDSYTYYGSGGQQVGQVTIGSETHASLWNGSSASWVDLNPAGASESVANDAEAGVQYGYASVAPGVPHASMWLGTPGSWADLNPPGADDSWVMGVSSAHQAGIATIGGAYHAGLWAGTACSWVDLHPAGYDSSRTHSISGNQQVGQATIGSQAHAFMWTGTAASWVDLNPSGASASTALRTDGVQQVGSANFAGFNHAGYWTGSAASWVDLHVGGGQSEALGVHAGEQAGYILDAGQNYHAVVWRGTSASVQYLEAFLPPGFVDSFADGIWSDTTFTYVSGYAYDTAADHYVALLWKRANPPTVAAPPSQAISAGQPLTLSVAVSGVGPFTYQWSRVNTDASGALIDGGRISGATTATLTISSVSGSAAGSDGDAGLYSVTVTNPGGQTTSAAAVIAVLGAPRGCGSADFNGDGDIGTDADIESFFRVLAGGSC